MKTIAVLAPMELEYLPLLQQLQAPNTSLLGGTRCTIGMLGQIRVILHECSVGKVNAALHTQLLIDTYHPDAILNVGIAGSLTRLAGHCTPVVVTECAYHDMRPGTLKSFHPYCNRFACDPELMALLWEAAGTDALVGMLVTGDKFISSSAQREAVLDAFPGESPYCVEMESTAVAQVACVNGIPFAALRCISDLADDSAKDDCEAFEHLAARRAAEIVAQAVQAMEDA